MLDDSEFSEFERNTNDEKGRVANTIISIGRVARKSTWYRKICSSFEVSSRKGPENKKQVGGQKRS